MLTKDKETIWHYSPDGELYAYDLQPGEWAYYRPEFIDIVDGDHFGGIQRIQSAASIIIVDSYNHERTLQISEMQHVPEEEWRPIELERKRARIRHVIRELHEQPHMVAGRAAMY